MFATATVGLAISKQIVDMMGGTIRFVSDPSVKPGTTCLIKLPLELWEEQPIPANDNDEYESSDENDSSSIPRDTRGPTNGYSSAITEETGSGNASHINSGQGLFSMSPTEYAVEEATEPTVASKKPKLGALLRMGAPARSGNSVASNDNKSHKSKNSNSCGPCGGSIASGDNKSRQNKEVKGKRISDGGDVVLPIERPFKLLLVDDIQMNRSMLKRRFAKKVASHAVVTEASTGEEALDLIKNEFQKLSEGGSGSRNLPYDVIVIDHYMEQAGGIMVGTDVVIAMRRMGLKSFIIGCSGNDMEQQFFDAGADIVWKKPMPSNDVMIQQIRRGLEGIYSNS